MCTYWRVKLKARECGEFRGRTWDIHAVYRLFQNYFRPRRMKLFASSLAISNETRIIDLGGNPLNWSFIEQTPEVTMVNIANGPWVKDLDPLHHKMVCFMMGVSFRFPTVALTFASRTR